MKATGKGKPPDQKSHPFQLLEEAVDSLRASRAREARRGGPLDLGNDRPSMIQATHLAGTAGQSLDLLVEQLEKLIPGSKAREEERLLGRVYEILLRTRKEVRAIHGALQAAEEAHDPPTEEESAW